jgi:hypothetical protein
VHAFLNFESASSEEPVIEEEEEREDEAATTTGTADLLPPYPIPDALELPPLPSSRRDRFPSVEDRVKVYMSNWYLPSCHDGGKARYRYLEPSDSRDASTVESTTARARKLWIEEPRNVVGASSTGYVVESRVVPDKAFFLNRTSLRECGHVDPGVTTSQAKLNQIKNLRLLYCPDVATTLLTALDHVLWEQGLEEDDRVPILMQFGDMRFSKVRSFALCTTPP